MRSKFAAAQSGLRMGKEGTFSFYPLNGKKGECPLSLCKLIVVCIPRPRSRH
jgi:hypothetical protein